MAVIASAQTLHVLQPRSVSSPQSRRFPPRFPRAPHVKTSLSFKSTEAPNIRHNLLVRASSTSDFNPDIGEILGEVSVFTASGESVLFKDLWDQKEGVAVVALLRHFGCFCCWELASALKESKARFDSAGVKLIAVGVGTPNKACILAERLPFPMDCLYADPDRKAYDVLGLYYGLSRTLFSPASAKVFSRFESLQKALKNYTLEGTPDDKSGVLQQGGMFVFKGKQLLYAWKDEGTVPWIWPRYDPKPMPKYLFTWSAQPAPLRCGLLRPRSNTCTGPVRELLLLRFLFSLSGLKFEATATRQNRCEED